MDRLGLLSAALVTAGLLAGCHHAPPPDSMVSTTTTTTTAVAPVVIAPMPLPAAMPVPPMPADNSDTLAVLASDFAFGPSMQDADVTARYYCSTKGKQPVFVRRDNPPELHAPSLLAGIKPTFTVMMYRCVTPAQ